MLHSHSGPSQEFLEKFLRLQGFRARLFKDSLFGCRSPRYWLRADTGIKNLAHPTQVSHRNIIHGRGQAMFSELKNSKRGSRWKHNIVMAAENCLLSRNCRKSSIGSISTQDHELQRSWDTPDSLSSFLTPSIDGKLDFIEGFRSVAHHIQLSRKKAKVSRRTRIAILDTGCRTDNISFFADSARSERLKNWEDFVTPKSSTKADTSGHGTLMTQLIMRIAPTADIYVIRVAENNHDLQAKGHAIAKVRATPASLAEMLTLD